MLANMGTLIGQTAQRYADRPALINVERERSFTYQQMHRLSNRISHMLCSRFELGSGQFYATLLDNDHMGFFHPWMFKCPAGAIWLDVRENTAALMAQIDLTGPRVVFIEHRHVAPLLDALVQRDIEIICMDPPPVRQARLHHFWDLVEAASDADFGVEAEFCDAHRQPAVLRFTGGTTGLPKCAQYSLSNLWTWGMNPAHFVYTMPFPHPVVLLSSPIHHAASGAQVIPMHLKGGTLVTQNQADLERLGPVVQEHKVDLIYSVPTVLYRMLDMNLAERYDLSSVKTIRYGAAPMSPSKLGALLEQFGPVFTRATARPNAGPRAPSWPRRTTPWRPLNSLTDWLPWDAPSPGRKYKSAIRKGTRFHLNQRGRYTSGEPTPFADTGTIRRIPPKIQVVF